VGKASSLRAQWLGERLKKARKDAGYTLVEAAEYLQLHEATLSRFESATYAVRKSYVKDLIDFYRISDQRERDALLQLCEDAWRKDWWDGQSSDVEHEFIDYTWLESRADEICVFEPMLVHGLLQTPKYARSIIRTAEAPDVTEEQVLRLMEFRIRRQQVLDGPDPTKLSVILDETVLCRPIGPVELMKEQLSHLVNMHRRGHIQIRLLPIAHGWKPGMSGAFTLFRMPAPYSDVAFVGGLAGRTYLEHEESVQRFRRAYDGLQESALTTAETNKLIRKAIKELQ